MLYKYIIEETDVQHSWSGEWRTSVPIGFKTLDFSLVCYRILVLTSAVQKSPETSTAVDQISAVYRSNLLIERIFSWLQGVMFTGWDLYIAALDTVHPNCLNSDTSIVMKQFVWKPTFNFTQSPCACLRCQFCVNNHDSVNNLATWCILLKSQNTMPVHWL